MNLPQSRRPRRLRNLWLQAIVLYGILAVLHGGRVLWTGDLPPAENMQNMPLCVYSWRCLRAGILPLWNPYAFCGIPHFETHHAAALYPLVYLIFGLFEPFRAFNTMMVLHYFWIGLGCWGLLRFGWRLRQGAALAGGAFFMLAGYNIAHEGHASLIWAVAWIPWLHWFSRRTLAGRRWAGPLLALLIFLQMGAGFIQISIYNWLVMGAEALVLMLRPPWGRPARRLAVWAAAVGCGLGLLSVQFLATAGILPMTNRLGLTYDIFTTAGFPLAQLPMLFFPLLMGADQPYLLVRKLSFGFSPQSEVIAAMGAAAWIGILLLLGRGGDAAGTPRLARPALRRQAWLWAGVIVFCLLAAIGEISPINKITFHIPVMKIFRVQTRWMVFMDLGVAILAALGFDRLLGVLERRRPLRLRATLLAGLALLAAAAPAAAAWIHLTRRQGLLQVNWSWFFGEWFHPGNPALWLPLAFGAAALGVLALLWRRPRAWRLCLALWIGLYALEQGILTAQVSLRLTMPARGYVAPGNDAARWMLAQHQGSADNFRVLTPTDDNVLLSEETMPIMLPQLNGIYSLGGYFPFETPTYFHLLRIFNTGTTADLYGLLGHPAILNMLNMRYLLVGHWFDGQTPCEDRPGLPTPRLITNLLEPGRYPWLRLVHRTPRGVSIFENTRALPRAWTVASLIPCRDNDQAIARFWDERGFDPARQACVTWTDGRPWNAAATGLTSGTARITRRTSDRLWIEVSSPKGPTFLVLSEAWYPGWWARLDGKLVPIHIANAILRGIEIPQGTHTLYLRYLPAGFVRGLKLSAGFGALWAGWMAWEWRRGRKRRKKKRHENPGGFTMADEKSRIEAASGS